MCFCNSDHNHILFGEYFVSFLDLSSCVCDRLCMHVYLCTLNAYVSFNKLFNKTFIHSFTWSAQVPKITITSHSHGHSDLYGHSYCQAWRTFYSQWSQRTVLLYFANVSWRVSSQQAPAMYCLLKHNHSSPLPTVRFHVRLLWLFPANPKKTCSCSLCWAGGRVWWLPLSSPLVSVAPRRIDSSWTRPSRSGHSPMCPPIRTSISGTSLMSACMQVGQTRAMVLPKSSRAVTDLPLSFIIIVRMPVWT